MNRWTKVLCFVVILATRHVLAQSTTPATPPADDREEIKARLDKLLQQVEALSKEAADLKARLEGTPAPAEDLTPAKAEEPPPAEIPVADIPIDVPAPAAPPLTVVSGAGGKNFLNLSLDGLVAAGTSTARDVGRVQQGGHDPNQRGFTVQNVETVFEGAVDPYFRGQANLVLQIDPTGATVVELEEVYATSTSLPAGLQLKAGQFFSEFGRLNPSHPHSWDFVDQPLVSGRFFGPDGLRSVGARLSWLMPTAFYSEATLAVQNGQGETATSFRSSPGETLFGRQIQGRDVASLGDLLIVPRYSTSFDLSDTKTILLGASAALGPNGTGPNGRTRIYGVDGFWKWKAANAFKGFPFLKIQGELMRRGVTADSSADGLLPRATFNDWGGYLQASWGYKPGYVAGLRLDRVGGDEGDPQDDDLAARWRVSPALTWFPTEYTKLRLQYNFDHSTAFARDEHSVWLQMEFLLGAHAAHKF